MGTVSLDTGLIGRVRVVIGVLLAALVLAGGPTGVTAAADTTDETAFVDAINEIRAEHGLVELQLHDELTEAARAHAETMAEVGEIFHADPISAGLTAEWQKLGENVGVGAGIQVLMDAFLASPGHYANLIDPAFTHVGVGVVRDGESLYTTHRFLQPPLDDGTPPPGPRADQPAPDRNHPGGPGSPERVAALFGLLDDIG